MFDQLKNLGGLGGLGDIMSIAKDMPGKVDEVQKRLAEVRQTGTAGGGMVEVDATGDGKILAVRIDSAAYAGEDPQVIQDLFLAATNDALAKTKKAAANVIEDATKDLPIPGLSDMLAKLSGNA